jgi:hypothetical protein
MKVRRTTWLLLGMSIVGLLLVGRIDLRISLIIAAIGIVAATVKLTLSNRD